MQYWSKPALRYFERAKALYEKKSTAGAKLNKQRSFYTVTMQEPDTAIKIL